MTTHTRSSSPASVVATAASPRVAPRAAPRAAVVDVWARRAAGLLALACLALPACQKPLFDARDPRSQYDRTDSVRNTRPEQLVFDEYGNRRPNIRGRLIGNQ